MGTAPVSAIERPAAELYVPEMCTITGARRLTAMERLFEIQRPDKQPLGHAPGQFVQISIFGFGEAPISVCSAANGNGKFQLCVRRAGSLTMALHALGAGDIVGVRGPFGHGFPVDSMRQRDVLIVAGGIGLAPVRSLIQHVLAEREAFGRLIVLYGTRDPSQVLFAEDFEQWRAAERTELLVTVDTPAPGWDGEVGVVTTLLPKVSIDVPNTVAAVVGPPVMYRFVLRDLREMQMPDERIFLSLERHMKCGVGKCGHCVIHDRYACIDGPVFAAAELAHLHEAI